MCLMISYGNGFCRRGKASSCAVGGQNIEIFQNDRFAFEVQERVTPGWNEVAPSRDTCEARNTNPDGAPVVSYLKRHPYAFEVEERVMPGCEVAPCRDSSEVRNTNPDGGTGADLPPTSPLRP
jgi:hypothetical protein